VLTKEVSQLFPRHPSLVGLAVFEVSEDLFGLGKVLPVPLTDLIIREKLIDAVGASVRHFSPFEHLFESLRIAARVFNRVSPNFPLFRYVQSLRRVLLGEAYVYLPYRDLGTPWNPVAAVLGEAIFVTPS